MLWYCWSQNHHSILCTIGIGHTGLDHLPSNLNIVYKLMVLLIMLLHLLVGTAHWTQSKIYQMLLLSLIHFQEDLLNQQKNVSHLQLS